MTPRAYLLVTLAAAAVGTGCAARRSGLDALNAQEPLEYRGHYTPGPQGSWFQPCGTTAAEEQWWVTVTGDAVPQVARARQEGRLADGKPSFVRWRAVFTRGGEVGPPGRGALLVREVLAIRPAASGDCAAP